jgi:hypothetical protein
VEAILEGEADSRVMLERLEQPPSASWEEQRQRGFVDDDISISRATFMARQGRLF